MRAKKNGGRAEPETAEDAGTLQRGLAEAQTESNRMAKEVQELTRKRAQLKEQLELLMSSKPSTQHQGGEAVAELASKTEQIKNLQVKIQSLRKSMRRNWRMHKGK